MDPHLLQYYNRELQHLREMGGEFAEAFPKIAERLGLSSFECADPYVERLLEGFAFLAARVQLKIDAEFPTFTRHLLEMVYPHYLAPTPSMAVVQFHPDPGEGALADGVAILRGSVLRSQLAKGEQTPCEYRTAHPVTLWPLRVVEAEYLPTTGAVSARGILSRRGRQGVKAAVRLRLGCTGGMGLDQLALDQLPVYLRGADDLAMRLYEQLLGNAVGLVARATEQPDPWQLRLASAPQRVGYSTEEGLLPYTRRSFQGYRLLHEYFAFPERFLSVRFDGLQPALRRCSGTELDLYILLDRADRTLEHGLDADRFALHCTPAINLFPKTCDRVHLSEREHEYHIVPDRTRPLDFEVYQVQGVSGYGSRGDQIREFLPFYSATDRLQRHADDAFYSVRRALHLNPRQRRYKEAMQRDYEPRSNYQSSEVYIALVDAAQAPYSGDLRQLAPSTLCTNRDLPLSMPVGKGGTDFTLQTSAPVESVRCLAGPTEPRAAMAEGDSAWRLISHLSLNYLTLVDNDSEQGAAGLRELLGLYADSRRASVRKRIEGVRSITSRPIVRRLPVRGPIAFGRGLEITVDCEEAAFEGSGVFLLGMVLEEFFAKYVSINSFTETVLRSMERGEVMRWPVRSGRRHTL